MRWPISSPRGALATRVAELRITVSAAGDLDSIFDHGASQWGIERAAAYVASFDTSFALLARFPEIGTARPEIAIGIRSTPHGSHLVYFSSDAEQVVIERVLHKRRVPRGHM